MFSFWNNSGQSNDQSNDQSNNPSNNPSQSTDPTMPKRTLTSDEIREQRAKKLQATIQSSNSSNEKSTNSPSNQTRPVPVPAPVQSRPQTPSQPPAQSTSSLAAPLRAPLQTSATSHSTGQSPSSHSPIIPLRTSQSTPLAVPSMLSMFTQLPQSLRPSTDPSTNQPINQSKDAWISEMICEVLQISIEKAKPGVRTSRTFLAEAARDAAEQSLNQSNNQKVVTIDMLDALFIERLSLPLFPFDCSLAYLIACYKRAYDLINMLSNLSNNVPQMITQSISPFFLSTSADFTTAIADCTTLLERVIAYSAIVLTDEDMTVDPEATNQPISIKKLNGRELLKMLMSDSLLSRPLPPYFLDYLVKQSDEDQLREIFSPLIDACGPMIGPGQQAIATSPFDLSRKKLQALSLMAKHASIARLIANHKSFIPPPPVMQNVPWMPAQTINHNGWTFQMQSLLGYHISHSVSAQEPVFAGNIRSKSRIEVDADMSRLRAEYEEYYAIIVDIFKSLIRDKNARERVCLFFTQIANINSIHIKRRQHGYDDPNSRSSDGLVFNSLRVILQLAAPIHAKKQLGDQVQDVKSFDVVKLEYALNKDPQRYINYSNTTRMSASTPDVTAKTAELDPASLTDFNFSTQIFFILHEFINLISPILREYMKLMQSTGQVQRDVQRGRASEEELSLLFSALCARDTHLQDPSWHRQMCAFYEYSSALVVSHLLKGGEQSLIKYAPETIIEGQLDYFVWIGQVGSKFFETISVSDFSFTQFATLLVTIAHGPHAIKNPHTRAKTSGVVLALFIPNGQHDANLGYVLDNPVFRAQLMPALIDLYVEIEFGAGMYYQKFNVRYEVTLILQHLWSQEHYKQQLIGLSADLTHFLLFTNALANDLVYLLDEALKLLSQIREYQQTENDPRPNETPEQKKEREDAHRQNEKQCTSLMQLASSTIAFVSQLSKSIREPFVTPQLDFCSRFATTLMYYINKLVGPSIANLNVQNKEKYHFAPRDLLQQIMQIFLHLSSSTLFIEKVAADERSYSPDIMNRAYSIINRRGILEEGEKRQFARVIHEIARAHAVAQDWEENIGDVPEQYGDALLSTLMSDPVMLPTSKMVVDRVTILRHLLNSKTDPFNRAPLTEAELIEQPELKQEIEQWIATKKAEYKARLAQQGDDMIIDDTTDDAKDNSPEPMVQ